jgi:hypothetical protein
LEDIPDGHYILKITYLGYESFEKKIEVDTSLSIDIHLEGSKYPENQSGFQDFMGTF